ncbi:MAG: hypothetical protein KIT61_02590 [Pyrinomonadaceae bacterium]|nr:hypothetical protein [Pyrinomonadaceae bacterium]
MDLAPGGHTFLFTRPMIYVPEETITTTKSPPPNGKDPARKKRYLYISIYV